MNAKRWIQLATMVALGGGVFGCSSSQKPPLEPRAKLDPTAPAPEGTFVADWPVLRGFEIDVVRDRALKARIGLNVGKDLRRRCDLPEPRFDFDSTATSEDDEAEIARLSRCFSTGPLRDRSLKLIGRADPRGDPSYNMELGRRRAERVKQLLVQGGVAPYRIKVISRGAQQAVASVAGYTDEDDRRVDILLD